jgi:Tfp pilus assembly protein PilF
LGILPIRSAATALPGDLNGEDQMNFAGSVFTRQLAVMILAAFAALLPQIATAQTNPLAGTWKFVPEKSTFTPGPARYRSMTLTIANSGEPVVTVEGVDAQGKPFKGGYTAVTDGKPHPITGMAGFDSGSWTRANDSVVTYQYLKGKGIAVLGTRALSPDGSTLTFHEQMYDDKGKQTSTAMMVFQNPDVKVASVKPPQSSAPVVTSLLTPEETDALAMLSKNDNDGAISRFTAVIESNQSTPMLYFDHISRGVAYLRKMQQDQALADFDAAVKLKPDNADARFHRGAMLVEQMKYQAAIDDLSVAIQSDSMNAEAYNMRSFAYYRLGQNANGAADTDKACAIKMEYCVK